MASTTTTLDGAVTASANTIKLTAFTAPTSTGNLSAKALLKVDDEIMLITDSVASPTLGVVRGYMGTSAVLHKTLAAAVYGIPGDMQDSKGPSFPFGSFPNPSMLTNAQAVTATGATGSTAATITAYAPAFLDCTGASGTGLNLPYPSVGASYAILNNGTGALNVYSVGATINGTTGTTAYAITATGNKAATASCSVAGAWKVFGNT